MYTQIKVYFANKVRYEANLPPIVKRNYGKWISHEHPRPGVIKHDSETGEAKSIRRVDLVLTK